MRHVKSFLVLAGAAALVGCAAQAPAPEPVATHTVVANPSAAASAAAFKTPFGYEKVVGDDGVERYCRNDLDTNSRVKRTRVCMTEAQLKASQDNSQSFMDDIQRHGGAATATGTPGAGH